MKLNKLQKDHPEYFQYLEEEFESVETPRFDKVELEIKTVDFKKLKSQREHSYPFYKHISRIISF